MISHDNVSQNLITVTLILMHAKRGALKKHDVGGPGATLIRKVLIAT